MFIPISCTTKYKGYAVSLEFSLSFFLPKCKLQKQSETSTYKKMNYIYFSLFLQFSTTKNCRNHI